MHKKLGFHAPGPLFHAYKAEVSRLGRHPPARTWRKTLAIVGHGDRGVCGRGGYNQSDGFGMGVAEGVGDRLLGDEGQLVLSQPRHARLPVALHLNGRLPVNLPIRRLLDR